MPRIHTESRWNESEGSLPICDGRLMDFTDDPIVCMQRLREEYGDICALREGSQQIVFAFGPEYNQRILCDEKTFQSRFFAVRGPRNSPQRRLTSGLLSMNGKQHRLHRRIVMEPFQLRSIVNNHELICRLAGEMLDGWQPGEVRDINQDMRQYMLRVTCALLFGLDRPELAYRTGAMIDRWVEMNHQTGMGAMVSDEVFNESYEQLLSLATELEEEIRTLIGERRANLDGNDVLSLLINAHDDEQGELSDEELIGHVALLFGAAHLTTANTFTWTLFLLSEHPSIMRQLHEEIGSKVAGDVPTREEVSELSLTERVIKESMRILPASGYLNRICMEPVKLGPFHLQRGTPVIFSQFITHHLPELYPNPQRFDPDRWLEISPSPYAYFPFGAGPRMCLGAPSSMMTFTTALPMILKRYRLSLIPAAEINGRIISTMLAPTTSMPMLVSRQDEKFSSSPVNGNIHTLVDLHEVGDATVRRAA